MKIDNNNKLERAKKRVEEIKGFYIHLAVYIVINAFLLVNVYIRTMGDGGNFWQLSTFFTLLFWGLNCLCSIHIFAQQAVPDSSQKAINPSIQIADTVFVTATRVGDAAAQAYTNSEIRLKSTIEIVFYFELCLTFSFEFPDKGTICLIYSIKEPIIA